MTEQQARFMTQALSTPQPLTKGLSRFRLRVRLVTTGLKPYGWEIYDEEDDQCVRRSSDRFRTSAEAWQAGSAFADTQSLSHC
jgi:hypothetical protein